jgi:hypothetical protein
LVEQFLNLLWGRLISAINVRNCADHESSEEMECGLSQDKIVKINTVLISAMHGKKITLRSPQSLIGLLNFACMAVCPDRAFLRHLVDLTVKMVSPFHFIMLTCEARTELQAWQSFIETFNGKSVFLADTSF